MPLLLLIVLLLLAAPCGAASLHLSGAPPVYRLEVSGFSQVAAIDVTISFDPSITVESFEIGPFLQGTMAASNIKIPGKVRLGAATTSPLSGAGLLGTLRLSSPDSSPHLEITAKLHDLQGKQLPISFETATNPAPIPFSGVASPAPPSPTESATTEAPTSGRPPVQSSTVIMMPRSLHDGAAGTTSKDRTLPLIESPPPSDRTPGAAFRAADLDKQEVGMDSPLPRFRKNFASLRTLGDLEQLFIPPQGIIQRPNPALSDGTTRVELLVEGGAEDFSIGVQGARMLEGRRGRDGWLHIELLPIAGSSEVIVIIVDQVVRSIALAIARPVPLDPARSAEDYLRLWQDIDGDGIITDEEAWTIAVNLLAAQQVE